MGTSISYKEAGLGEEETEKLGTVGQAREIGETQT